MFFKLLKEKGCEELIDWIKLCENYFYWSAVIRFSGNGFVIWAKFKIFLSYIINKYFFFFDLLFNKCGFREIRFRRWFYVGMICDIKYICIILFDICY